MSNDFTNLYLLRVLYSKRSKKNRYCSRIVAILHLDCSFQPYRLVNGPKFYIRLLTSPFSVSASNLKGSDHNSH